MCNRLVRLAGLIVLMVEGHARGRLARKARMNWRGRVYEAKADSAPPPIRLRSRDDRYHFERCVLAVMVVVMAWIVAGTLAAIGGLHVYWALGGTAGIATAGAVVPEVGGRPAFTPGPVSTLAIAALLEIAAALVALQGKLFAIGGLPPALIRVGALGVAVVLAARGIGDFRLVGLFKRVRDTRFARLDSRVYVPLCLALATGIVIVAAA